MGAESISSRLLFSVGRSRPGEKIDYAVEAKRENQREISNDLLRRLTDINPDDLERLRARIEKKPDKVTPEQEIQIHEGVINLAMVRMKGAQQIELKDLESDEKVIISSATGKAISRIEHLSPDHQEVATNDGIVTIKPSYVLDFRKIGDEQREMLRQENSISSFSEHGKLIGTRVMSRMPEPLEVAWLVPLLRDGEMTRQVASE